MVIAATAAQSIQDRRRIAISDDFAPFVAVRDCPADRDVSRRPLRGFC
jgi:hypothetical protein